VATAATHLILKCPVLTKQAHDTGQVFTIIIRGQDLLLFPYPAFLFCHLPEELPKATGLFQAGPTLGCQLAKFLIAELHVGHTVPDHLGVTGLVACFNTKEEI
jgi:hypothetical protein